MVLPPTASRQALAEELTPSLALEKTLADSAVGFLRNLAARSTKRLETFDADYDDFSSGFFPVDAYARALLIPRGAFHLMQRWESGQLAMGWAPDRFFQPLPSSLEDPSQAAETRPFTFVLSSDSSRTHGSISLYRDFSGSSRDFGRAPRPHGQAPQPSRVLDDLEESLPVVESAATEKEMDNQYVLDSASSVSLAYYSALRVALWSPEDGDRKFDALFGADTRTPLVISDLRWPGNPLHLLVESRQGPLVPGRVVVFQGHPDYRARHPHGHAGTLTALCGQAREQGQETFVALGLEPDGTAREVAEHLHREHGAIPLGDLLEMAANLRGLDTGKAWDYLIEERPKRRLPLAETRLSASSDSPAAAPILHVLGFNLPRIQKLKDASPGQARGLMDAWADQDKENGL
jgi:hypothetical protein